MKKNITLFDTIKMKYDNEMKKKDSCLFFAYRPMGANDILSERIFELIEQHILINKMDKVEHTDQELLQYIVKIVKQHNSGIPPRYLADGLTQHFNIKNWGFKFRNQFGTLQLHSYAGRFKQYYWTYKTTQIEGLQRLIHQKTTHPEQHNDSDDPKPICTVS